MLPIDINEPTLQEICAQRWSESSTLDFKRTLPGLSDREKSELLKDICAFANSDGGDIVYGIVEEAGMAKLLAPLTEDRDATKRRLGQVVDAGLEPRVVGLHFRDIALSNGGFALVVRVPPSFNGPHRYIVNNVGRFVMRTGTHTTELSYDQLRTAFDRTATLAERARRFREDRIKAIQDRYTWRPIAEGPICVVHFVPIAGIAGTRTVDIQYLYNNFTPFIFSGWGGATRSTNLDGLAVYGPGDGTLGAYTHIFRNGALEAVRIVGGTHNEQKLVYGTVLDAFLREAIKKFGDQCRQLGFTGPVVVGIALLAVPGYVFHPGSAFFLRMSPPQADRPNLVVPEVLLSNIEAASQIDEVARPLLDILWQAFGFERCYEYDDQGKWKSRG